MNKGIVYKIEVGDELYIGSTEQTLCARQSCHNRDLKKYPHRKLYKACIDNGINKIKCWWVADIVFNSFEERRIIEETYRKQLHAELNSCKCHRSREETLEYYKQYYLDHKEEKNQYHKQYSIDHKEETLEYQKQYKLDHKEQLTEYFKQYHIDHKEKRKQDRIANREAINARRRENYLRKKLLKQKIIIKNNNNDQSNSR